MLSYKNFKLLNESVVFTDIKMEEKTIEHYKFLSDGFDMFIEEKDFLGREDLFVVTLRDNNNELVAVSLNRKGKTPRTGTIIIRIMFTYVKKEYRNLEINTKMNKVIEQYSKSIGAKKLVCNIKDTNVASIKSFTKSGFTIDVNKIGTYKDGDKKLFLFKRI